MVASCIALYGRSFIRAVLSLVLRREEDSAVNSHRKTSMATPEHYQTDNQF